MYVVFYAGPAYEFVIHKLVKERLVCVLRFFLRFNAKTNLASQGMVCEENILPGGCF